MLDEDLWSAGCDECKTKDEWVIVTLFKGFIQYVLWLSDELCNIYHEQCVFIFDNLIHIIPITAVISYILMLIFLPKFLIWYRGRSKKTKTESAQPKETQDAKKVKRRYGMVAWNLFLAVSSYSMLCFGFAPFAIRWLTHNGFLDSMCNEGDQIRKEVYGSFFWIELFVYYKYVELLDTFFLIWKNPRRKVSFLHCYHHITVLLISHYAKCAKVGVGVWFGFMNAAVHTMMYVYYFLTSLGYKPKWAFRLTILQIVQMFAGMILTVIWLVVAIVFPGVCNCEIFGKHCYGVIFSGFFFPVYGAYFVLFIRFAIKKYWKPKN